MIKIDLDTKQKGRTTKYVISGSVEIHGDIDTVAHEIYEIIKNFEENVHDALELAMEKLVNEGRTNE